MLVGPVKDLSKGQDIYVNESNISTVFVSTLFEEGLANDLYKQKLEEVTKHPEAFGVGLTNAQVHKICADYAGSNSNKKTFTIEMNNKSSIRISEEDFLRFFDVRANTPE